MLLDGRPCVTKCEHCEKDGKVYVNRVSEISNTSLNVRILGMVVSQDSHALSLLH